MGPRGSIWRVLDVGRGGPLYTLAGSRHWRRVAGLLGRPVVRCWSCCLDGVDQQV